MADGPVTIADVAAAAGVSVATVSKVINDRYGVAEQTSARVREVIEQLGYTSSLVAQSLRSRRSNVIGVIASDIEPFNAELLKGAARGLRGTGYDHIVFRGVMADRAFAAFYYKGDRLIAVDAVNRPAEYLGAKMLIQTGRTLPPAVLEDASRPMKELVASAR